jgi:hypothetical protein
MMGAQGGMVIKIFKKDGGGGGILSLGRTGAQRVSS